ncbi:hypothetical protein H4R19_000203 [Coemansia spiralis]|nr:hypothetical protein H4R19_000203 [Coemansia spiralis]
MQLCDLPTDILTAVLERSLRDRDDVWGLELNLPLAAICRRLRYIALPIVYKEVYIDAFDEDSTHRYEFSVDFSRNEPGHSTPNDQGAYGGWRAITNVDIIASMGYTGLVQHVGIEMEAGHGHVGCLRHAVRYLCNAASEWPTVKRLDIWMKDPDFDSPVRFNDSDSYAYSDSDDSDSDDSDDADEFAQLALALRAMMPNAHGLDFSDSRCFPAPTFGEQLIQHYHQQLRMLHFTVWTNGPPSIDAAQDGRSFKLDFPLLRSARIHCSSEPCPLLASAVSPRLMGSLDIQVSASVWQSISHMELPVAQRLKLVIQSPDRSITRHPLSFNRLLTNSHQCGKVALYANYHDPSAYLPSIAFTGLTMLAIGRPISADMLLDTIGKLPQLVILVATHSARDTIQADIAIPSPSEHYPVEPLGAKLRSLSYGRKDDYWQSRTNVALYKYFLLKHPSLRWFGARDELLKELVPFVEAYREWYPHLAGVNFCSKSYWCI